MALRPIRLAGDPVLRQKTKKVRVIDESIQKLIDDMIDTMRDAPGVGLAANQIGVGLRVIVMEIPEGDDRSTSGERSLYALINPQIVKRSGRRMLEEGCLSIPGYKAVVPRSQTVTVKGLDRNGKEVRIKADGDLLAQCIEHECDHVDGALYIDLLENIDELVKIGDADDDEDATEDERQESAVGNE